MQGWRWVDVDEKTRLLENATGHRCATTQEAFDYEFATNQSGADAFQQLSFVQKFLNDCCTEKLEIAQETEEGTKRQIVTTSSLDDWLWRGDHPVVKDMHWYVYSMWVYRIEIQRPTKRDDDGQLKTPPPRFIDIDFSPDYKLHRTHKQRIATEFRVPHFEGFTMPPSTEDSETAAMFKSLLLRAISVEVNDNPEGV